MKPPRFPRGNRGFSGNAGWGVMGSLPFSISAYGGLGRADGLVRLEGHSVIVEFEVQDRLLGWFRSELKEQRIPLSEIDDIRLETRWFRKPRLVVQTETMRVSRQIPGSQHGTFELTLEPGHELAARHLISTIEIAKADGRASHQSPNGLK